MKKKLTVLAVVGIILVGFVIFLQNVNLNRIGAQEYYVQINQDGTRMEDKLDNGKKYVSYEYALKGFDVKGNEKKLVFTANKQLRKDAYLRIYVKGSEVSSYQEVQANELPETAKHKLESVVK